MATVAQVSPPASTKETTRDVEARIVLRNVPWDTYLSLVETNSEGPIRLTYDLGTLELMTLSRDHERLGRFVHRLVGALSEELGIEICSTGATTMHSGELQRGAQADESFYIRNEPLVRGHAREGFDPSSPPDLAVEIDLSSDSSRRMPTYAELGIAEVWRYDGKCLTFQALRRPGCYRPIKRSVSFPKLAAADMQRFLDQYDSMARAPWSPNSGNGSAIRCYDTGRWRYGSMSAVNQPRDYESHHPATASDTKRRSSAAY